MSELKYHIFICDNERKADDARGSCGPKGSDAVRDFLKKEIKKRGLGKVARANKAGCLDACAFGPAVVIYPEGVWYTLKDEKDALEVVEKHLVGGHVVEHLRMRR